MRARIHDGAPPTFETYTRSRLLAGEESSKRIDPNLTLVRTIPLFLLLKACLSAPFPLSPGAVSRVPGKSPPSKRGTREIFRWVPVDTGIRCPLPAAAPGRGYGQACRPRSSSGPVWHDLRSCGNNHRLRALQPEERERGGLQVRHSICICIMFVYRLCSTLCSATPTRTLLRPHSQLLGISPLHTCGKYITEESASSPKPNQPCQRCAEPNLFPSPGTHGPEQL